MPPQEQFLSKRQRYQPIALPQHFSDEELARDWTLFAGDHHEIARYRKGSRLYIAIQICAVRLYGRFVNPFHDVSPHIVNYLGQQLDLPPSLTVEVPEREATYLEHRQNVLKHLGFQRFDQRVQEQLEAWLEQQARRGLLPDALFQQAENHLLDRRVLLPGPSVLERLIIHVCSNVHVELFETVFRRLSPSCARPLTSCCWFPRASSAPPFITSKNIRLPPRSPRYNPTSNGITPSPQRGSTMVRSRY